MVASGCTNSVPLSPPANHNNNIVSAVTETQKKFSFSQRESQSDFDQRATDLLGALWKKNALIGSDFAISTIVAEKGLGLINILQSSYSKRYTDEEILKEFKSMMEATGPNLELLINVSFIGDVMSDKKLPLDNKSYEFFFLENDKGEYVRASGQKTDNPYMFGDVDSVNQSLTFSISFPIEKFNEIVNGTKHLYLTFEGLNIKEKGSNRIEILYPFNGYYKDKFPGVDSMLADIESFQK